jgi:hypothetical protein
MRNQANLLLRLYGESRRRAAEYWGPANLELDRWLQLNGVPERAQEWYAAQDPTFRKYLDAFARGINDFATVERKQEDMFTHALGSAAAIHAPAALRESHLGPVGGAITAAVIPGSIHQPEQALHDNTEREDGNIGPDVTDLAFSVGIHRAFGVRHHYTCIRRKPIMLKRRLDQPSLPLP